MKTSGQSNLPGIIRLHHRHTHGRLNCIRQVAPMCSPNTEIQKMAAMAMSRSCRVLAISAFRRPTTQFPSTTNCLVTIIHTKPVIAILVPKLVAMAMFLSTSGPPSNTWFPGPVWAHNANGIWIGSAVFAQMTIEGPYTLQWDAPSPPPKKLPFLMGGSGPLFNR